MVIPALMLLMALLALLPSLKSGWYALHVGGVLAILWLGWPELREQLLPDATSALIIAVVHLLSVNAVMVMMLAYDKYAAQRGQWRIPEKRLHTFALIGATPASFYARRWLRHKTSKQSFRREAALVVMAQVFVLLILFGLVAFGH